jgi:hypothetical protein
MVDPRAEEVEALRNLDPFGFEAGDTNLYRYVSNSPTNLTDPSGLETQAPKVPTPDWQPYMKNISWKVVSTEDCASNSGPPGDRLQFKDKVGNTFTVRCTNLRTAAFRWEGQITPSSVPPFKPQVEVNGQPADVLGPHGVCKLPMGVNAWVFYTDDKGEMTKIVWINLNVKDPNPTARFNDARAKKEREARQNAVQSDLNATLNKYRDDPATAEKELRKFANDPRVDRENIQTITVTFIDIRKKK